MQYKLKPPSLLSELPIGVRIVSKAGMIHAYAWFALFFVAGIVLAGQFSARHPATVALDVGISIIRLGLPLLLIFTLQELVGREFERRIYLTSMAYPRARSQWLLSRLLTTFTLLVTLIVIFGILLAIIVSLIGSGYQQDTPPDLGTPYIITLVLISLDTLVILSIASFLSVVATSSFLFILGTLGFTLIARSYMPVIQLLQDSGFLVESIASPESYKTTLGLLAFLLPDLGSLDVRMIALYGKLSFLPENIWLLIAAALAYSFALITIAVWRLNRREFS